MVWNSSSFQPVEEIVRIVDTIFVGAERAEEAAP
jgi:hypothetical protein